MIGDLRAQEHRRCEHAPLDCDDLELPWRCVGCARDGTRWVTVGTLDDRGCTVVPGQVSGYVEERRYAIRRSS